MTPRVPERGPSTPPSRKAMERLFREGRRGRHALLMMVVLGAQPKKSFGCNALRTVKGSVIRNRLKRQMRGIWRSHAGELKGGTQVFVLLTPRAVGATYSSLEQAFLMTAKKMSVLNP